jgi:hypothetical protein
MSRLGPVAVIFTSFAFSTVSFAATVNTVQGKISVNRGTGFKPVSGGTGAAPGDKVMAGPNSSGQIVYDSGCVVEVAAGSVVTVMAAPPCAAGSAFLGAGAETFVPVVAAAAVVGGGLAAISASSDGSPAPAPASP